MQRRIPIPNSLQELTRLFSEAGVPLYAVGGMVRNSLMNLPRSDMDITSAMRPEEVLNLARVNGIKCIPKGIAFGTVELHLGGESYEHTTFRADQYGTGGTHRPEAVKFSDHLEEDAFRRDFSVNALYYDLGSEKILDPTGGLNDLDLHRIRTTNDDPAMILRDDALRILRMVRFSAELGFSIEEDTFSAAQANVQGLCDISAERVREELNKILLSDARYGIEGAVLAGLEQLDRLGALDVTLPELARGRGVRQRKQYHAYDVLGHSLHTAACSRPLLYLRLAGLLHDVGKPVVKEETGKMYGHDAVGAEIAREMLCRLKYPNQMIDTVTQLIRNHMYDLTGLAKESTLRMKFAELGYDNSLSLCEIREADVHGSGFVTGEVETAARWRRIISQMLKERAPFSENELNCTGQEIMEWTGVAPSPKIGEIKHGLFLHCAKKPADNRPEKLKKLAKDMM